MWYYPVIKGAEGGILITKIATSPRLVACVISLPEIIINFENERDDYFCHLNKNFTYSNKSLKLENRNKVYRKQTLDLL